MSTLASGTIAAANGTLDFTPYTSQGTSSVQFENCGSNVFIAEGSQDGSTWVAVQLVNAAGTPVASVTSDGIYTIQTTGLIYLRLRCTSYSSGTTTIIGLLSDNSLATYVTAALLPGSNNVGTVSLASGSTVGLAAGSNTIGSVNVSAPSGSGVAPSTYFASSATAGTYTVKSSPGVLYGVYLNGITLTGTVAIEDGSTTVLPTGLLGSTLASAPFSIDFPNGIQFTTNIKVALGGLPTSGVTVLYR
jgi:hypothetical protein